MKLLVVFVLVFAMSGCDPDCTDPIPIPTPEVCMAEKAPIYHPGEMTYGRVAGLKNCLPFIASATVYLNPNKVGLVIETFEDFTDYFSDKETIMLVSEANGKGIWPLIKDTVPNQHFQAYWTVQDHDVFESIFQIDTNYINNRIIVTMIDSVNKIVHGSFDARFLLEDQVANGKNPDTVIFTECNFLTRQP